MIVWKRRTCAACGRGVERSVWTIEGLFDKEGLKFTCFLFICLFLLSSETFGNVLFPRYLCN
jgi:hypothetical protein